MTKIEDRGCWNCLHLQELKDKGLFGKKTCPYAPENCLHRCLSWLEQTKEVVNAK